MRERREKEVFLSGQELTCVLGKAGMTEGMWAECAGSSPLNQPLHGGRGRGEAADQQVLSGGGWLVIAPGRALGAL